MALRLLHIADVHLETPFFGEDEQVRSKLRQAVHTSFSNAVQAAIDRSVHGLLIAGDLFDSDRLSFATERLLLEEAERLRAAGIAVYYATGNHDPGGANARILHLPWPENVHIFSGSTPRTVTLTDRRGEPLGRLTGAGHARPGEATNLAGGFEPVDGELPHAGLVHAQVLSGTAPPEHEPYAPCTLEDLRAAGLDYWALGHVHRCQQVLDAPPAWYAGNLQGRHPKEAGPKGGFYLELGAGGLERHEFLPLAPLVWHRLELCCSKEASTFHSIVEDLVSGMRRQLRLDEGRDHFIRLDLSGESPLADEICETNDNLRELTAAVQAEIDCSWMEIRPNRLVRPVDLEAHRGTASVLGEALDLLERLHRDDAALQEVRPRALARRDIHNETAYLKELLQGADRELASLLLPKQDD
jgi:DNA repair exonuclease SbcCD nuclease subunit